MRDLLEQTMGVNIEGGGFTDDEIRTAAEGISVDFDKVDFEQLKKGVEVEMEHQDVTGGDLLMTVKIALDHLKEMPDYYTQLEKMEKGECNWDTDEDEEEIEEKEKAAVLKWRQKQKPGEIMKPSTFADIAKKAKEGGATDPEKVAGAAYWKTVRAKYRKAKGKK